MSRRLTVLAAVVTVLAVAGCGSTSDSSHGATSHAAPPRSSKAVQNNALLPPGQLGIQAMAALKSVRSVRISASVTGKTRLAFDMHYGSTSSQGTVTLDGALIQLITVNKATYLKAPDAFWRKHASASVTSLLAYASGKWVKVPAANSTFAEFAAIGDKDAFISQLSLPSPPASFVKGSRKTIGGVHTVSFVDPANRTTVYVHATGKPYPVEAHGKTSAGTATARFSDYNRPFAATPPPAAQIFDLSAFVR